MWTLIQGSIVAAFVVWNQHDHWTPNPLVPGVVGMVVAYLFTLIASAWIERLRGARQQTDMAIDLPSQDQFVSCRGLAQQELGNGRINQRLGK